MSKTMPKDTLQPDASQLTAKERRIGMASSRGFIAEFMTVPNLDPDRELALIKAWQNDGDIEARNIVINAYMKMVVKKCQRYLKGVADREDRSKDLAQVGFFGLERAIDKFDVDLGVRFATFASFWVKAMIDKERRGLESIVPHSSNGRLKSLADNLPRAMNKAKHDADIRGHRISHEELLMKAANLLGMPEEYVRKHEGKMLRSDVSVNVKKNTADGDEREYQDFMEDEAPSIDHHLASSNMHDAVKDLIRDFAKQTDARKLDILMSRIYVEKEDVVTLAVMGEKYGISRERVRQLEVAVLQDLQRFAAKRNMKAGQFF